MAASEDACKPVATWMKICRQDFAAIVGIACFIIYVLWGVGPTIKAFNWCRRKLSRKPTDVEKKNDDDGLEYEDQDPYHSPTQLLKRFLARDVAAHTAVPPTTYLPKLARSSSRRSSTPPHYSTLPLHDADVQLRLARFQFPASRARRGSSPESLPDLFSSANRYSQCSQETDLETLDDLVLNSESRKELDYEDKVCFDLTERLEECGRVEAAEPVVVRLPHIPPPAHLDLDREMEPERFEYHSL